ncbi:ATP-dependent nuclease [Ancylobacter radicis]|uniref:AAA family ATPase n=1 Tax=Ancylobacter radicis TaxID=2836179 RepID=A0ABS5R8S8_9HYPH|nr:AAA family ATPase [Ancylobacter radicis]MBS9478075.1 AAA family ATPase [Ancylobacter radicis]
MKIKSIRIRNYKCFSDSGFVNLSGSWNIIVGRNNVGKTSFVESFRLSRTKNKPHRSIDTPRGRVNSSGSYFDVRLDVGVDLIREFFEYSPEDFYLPYAPQPEAGGSSIEPSRFWEMGAISVDLLFSPGALASSAWPSHGLFEASRPGGLCAVYENSQGTKDLSDWRVQNTSMDSIPFAIDYMFPSRIYVFDDKRSARGEYIYRDSSKLEPDASNLAVVLSKMSANIDLFAEFNRNLSEIIDGIRGVSVTPRNDEFQILIWGVDPSTRRDDLAVPLSECGAGVGQVLSILYVAMTLPPGVIVIDEPNSFLNSGASKKLINVLKRYSQHQYIVSTHAPEVIAAAQPANLHLITNDGNVASVKTFGDAEVNDKRLILAEIGVSLSDVLSAERVIWVEGVTERECFDFILNTQLGGPIAGVSFLALRNTGDLTGKQAEAALDIYNSITRGGSIMPLSVVFSFDSEGKTADTMSEIKRRLGGKVRFLERRMTENYFLNPDAIAKVLNKYGEVDVTAEVIQSLLRECSHRRVPPNFSGEFGTGEFLKVVDGANLLVDIFHRASNSIHAYRKVVDGVELLKVILSDHRDSVVELIDFVDALVRTENG